jgi:hypothetical protein
MTSFTSTEFVSGIERMLVSSSMNMGGCYQRQQSVSILPKCSVIKTVKNSTS